MNTIVSSALSLSPSIVNADGKKTTNPLVQKFSGDEAIFLSQLHEKLTSQATKVIDSEQWTETSYSEWTALLHVTTHQIRATVKKLRDKGVIKVTQLEKSFNKRYLYTIDYKTLEAALGIQSVTQ